MTWAFPELLLLCVLPVIGITVSIIHGRKRKVSLQNERLTRVTFGATGATTTQRAPRSGIPILIWLAMIFAVIAIARPQYGEREEEVFERSREVFIALDLSKSMLAQDVKPNRLERAKLLIAGLLESLKGENVGLIGFAGDAYVQSPLSPDYHILGELLESLDPTFALEGGTDYSRMLELSIKSFSKGEGEATDRFLIVISDGESLDDTWQAAAKEAAEKNIRVIALGIGTLAGGFIPDGSNGFQKNHEGAVIKTKLQSSTLKELAEITNGYFHQTNTWVDLNDLIEKSVKAAEATERKAKKTVSQIERFQWALLPALLCAFIGIWTEFPTLPKARKIKA